jgi:hypothetical protein
MLMANLIPALRAAKPIRWRARMQTLLDYSVTSNHVRVR